MFKNLYHTSTRNIFGRLLRRSGNSKQCNLRDLSSMERDRAAIGNREIVGYGFNGEPMYADRPDFPFPSIRYRELTPQIEALREKEKGDWRKLTEEERKCLYRYSFCLTFAEFQSPTGQWKGVLGWLLFYMGLGFFFYTFVHHKMLYRNLVMPHTFGHEHVYYSMARMINLNMNPITGLCSHWDFETNNWKYPIAGYENPFEVIEEYKKLKGEGTAE